jgi:membrane associated rhomboid family serine protease
MVFLPLKDDNSLKHIGFQFTTVTLILINIAVYVWQASLAEPNFDQAVVAAGLTPVSVFNGAPLEWLGNLPSQTTFITYMFLHGDIWHLVGNMLFLWVLGDNVEDAMGSIAFLIFYLLAGVAAALAHIFANVGSPAPLIGASGAVAGVVGAYLLLYPRVWMWSLAFGRIPLKLPAWVVILGWIGTQLFFVAYGIEDGTAWWAHIGGFVAGVVLILVFKRSAARLGA